MRPPPRRFPKPTKVKGVRMTEEEIATLKRLAAAAGCTEGDLVRHLVAEYARLKSREGE